jgi:hypothetical protein
MIELEVYARTAAAPVADPNPARDPPGPSAPQPAINRPEAAQDWDAAP